MVDNLFNVFDGAGRIPFDEYLLEAAVHHLGDHGTVVTPHRLNTLAVDLVVGLGPREVEAGGSRDRKVSF